MLKALIFDMDGVIVDSEGYYIAEILNLMTTYGYSGSAQDIAFLCGLSDAQTLATISRVTGHEIAKDEFDGACAKVRAKINDTLDPDIYALLAALSAHHVQCSIASSSPMDVIMDVLRAAKIQSYFKHITSGDMFTHSKPDPQIYQHALNLTGKEPSEVWVVEDAPNGIEAAKRAGLRVIAKKSPLFRLDQTAADRQIERLLELIPLLDTDF